MIGEKESEAKKLPLTSIAKRAKVSAGTVSRVFNNSPLVNRETKDKVLEIARRMGVRPRVGVRQKNLALITEPPRRTVLGGYVSSLTQHVCFAASQLDASVSMITEDRLDALKSVWFDGVIAVAWFPETVRLLQELESVPVVWLNRADLADRFSVVMTDHFESGRQAADYALSRGHRSLAVFYSQNDPAHLLRVEGMRAALAERGEDPASLLALEDIYKPQMGIKRLLEAKSDFVWVPSEDMHPLEVMWMLQEVAGREIPREISVLGMENQGVSQYLRPALTTFSQPLADMAAKAVEIALSSSSERRLELFPFKLIERQSVALRGDAP